MPISAGVRPASFITYAPSFSAYSLSPDFVDAPLSTTALWNSPFADGIAVSVHTFAPPPDCPMIVTFAGSPPNRAMLSRTHSRAATMSSMPTLPDAANGSPPTPARLVNPSWPRR